jgi:hypothetical protein
MIYIYIFNRSWVDTRWQQYITHVATLDVTLNRFVRRILLYNLLQYFTTQRDGKYQDILQNAPFYLRPVCSAVCANS